jgi:hypothetical protein
MPAAPQRFGGETGAASGDYRPAQPATPRHEINSIRSSLLKKPLSSLLKD